MLTGQQHGMLVHRLAGKINAILKRNIINSRIFGFPAFGKITSFINDLFVVLIKRSYLYLRKQKVVKATFIRKWSKQKKIETNKIFVIRATVYFVCSIF